MNELLNRRILLGISGGIAAYKAAETARQLIKAGAIVRVVMTAGGQKFITPLTLQALTGQPVHTELLDPAAEAGMGHIELARWPELILVAPASANLISRLAQGAADDLLTTLCLASEAPIALAPAMNHLMWSNPATSANCELLRSRGVRLWGPASGDQACGEVGPGRMLEPTELCARVSAQLRHGSLQGRTVVVTAGPTEEPIDPVRYLSNRSSGKMGFALAQAARDAGAQVVLISGPCNLTDPAGVKMIKVRTAAEMLAASQTWLGKMDIFIAAAAVADFRPEQVFEHKQKKQENEAARVLKLVPNPDIVAQISASDSRPFTVGFAAETENLTAYAQNKLVRKNLDMVIANDVSRPDIGFMSERNAVEVITPTAVKSLPEKGKTELARDLIAIIADAVGGRTTE